jgi:hypothetical protein
MGPELSDLDPGDVLLYRPKGLVGWLIASRTWSNWAHVEVYIGAGRSVASRDGIGVDEYPVRLTELGRVLRPHQRIDRSAAMTWFHAKAQGQRYDYLAILRFLLPHFITRDLDTTRQICSAFAVRFLRAGGVDLVAPDLDADLVAPSTLVATPAAVVLWTDGRP